MARRAADRLPEIRRILLFGSLVRGIPTPRSDADLLVEIAESGHERPGDRLPAMLRALSPLPCPVDLFVYTTDELQAMVAEDSPLVRVALRDGVDLLDSAA